MSEFTFELRQGQGGISGQQEQTALRMRCAVFEKLTLESINARAVLVPLRRPVVSKVGLFKDWPLILIDLYTREGIVGRSYLEPYLKNAARYIVPAIHDLAAALQGKSLAPLDNFQSNRRSSKLSAHQRSRSGSHTDTVTSMMLRTPSSARIASRALTPSAKTRRLIRSTTLNS